MVHLEGSEFPVTRGKTKESNGHITKVIQRGHLNMSFRLDSISFRKCFRFEIL